MSASGSIDMASYPLVDSAGVGWPLVTFCYMTLHYVMFRYVTLQCSAVQCSASAAEMTCVVKSLLCREPVSGLECNLTTYHNNTLSHTI